MCVFDVEKPKGEEWIKREGVTNIYAMGMHKVMVNTEVIML